MIREFSTHGSESSLVLPRRRLLGFGDLYQSGQPQKKPDEGFDETENCLAFFETQIRCKISSTIQRYRMCFLTG
jgi:hypothetical protein